MSRHAYPYAPILDQPSEHYAAYVPRHRADGDPVVFTPEDLGYEVTP